MAKTRRTYQPSKIKRIRKLGYKARTATKGGKKVIKSRILKGRKKLSVSDEFRTGKRKKFKRLR